MPESDLSKNQENQDVTIHLNCYYFTLFFLAFDTLQRCNSNCTCTTGLFPYNVPDFHRMSDTGKITYLRPNRLTGTSIIETSVVPCNDNQTAFLDIPF